MQTPVSLAKVSIVGNHWFPSVPGGLDRYIYELAYALIDLGCEVDLAGIGLPTQSPVPGLKLTNLASPDQSLPKRLWSAGQTYRKERDATVDVVNLHFALNSFPLLPYLPAEVPVVATFHGPWFQESQQEGDRQLVVFLKKQLERLVYRKCDRFIVLSKAFGEILHQEFGIAWDQINVIPGGVDTRRFCISLSRQQAREQLGWPQDRFILFTPRRLVQRMGLGQLLDAIAPLATQGQDIWLAIAGKGPLKDRLEEQVRELNLQNQVKFLGFLPDDDLPIAYQAADLTVMPSQSLEGFGLVLLESLACGTPVLCTPIGGMPEVIQAFSPELITTNATAVGLQNSLDKILTGAIALPSREACRTYAETNFNWTQIVQRVQSVLVGSNSSTF
ncbi:glycosyltransferase family 4 protein [Pseudanabaena sp. FACHB-2040]|uniref:glycosyltransferase family 4 protein n=1 Tax=Pseudanabaena sp. FACHB-2040 TaxID=2692859 RepID=UPI001683621A|nr:glycosyltransferase family 4 protein [Pseudanabaena sp. FACHB-2040]MBD2260578.1 glycosyltransferase family 4 protein [Pseudanabaena sp. FACHB-2040]